MSATEKLHMYIRSHYWEELIKSNPRIGPRKIH